MWTTFLKSLLKLLPYCIYFMFWFFGCEACGILPPRPGIKPATSALEGEVLNTGPLDKSSGPHFERQCWRVLKFQLYTSSPEALSRWNRSEPGALYFYFYLFFWWSSVFLPGHRSFRSTGTQTWLYVGMTGECSVTSVISDSFTTPWTVALQSPLSMRFSRQEYWSGLPCPPPRDLPDPEIESACPGSLALQMHSLATEPPRKPLRMTGGALKTTNARHSVLEILNSDSAWASGGFKVPKWLSAYESLRTLDLE